MTVTSISVLLDLKNERRAKSYIEGWYGNLAALTRNGEKMNNLPNCPKCNSEYVYEDGTLLVCPECAYEWNPAEVQEVEEGPVAIDANGNKLADGDTVTLIKDLKVKGAPKDLKQGTRVKNIRIVEGDHNIDCKIDGFGAMKLKSEFVKKI